MSSDSFVELHFC